MRNSFTGPMGAPDNLQILCQFHPACSAALRGALHESGAPILQTRSVAEGLQNTSFTGWTASGEPDTKTLTLNSHKFSEKERLFQSGANLCWAFALP